MILKSNHTLMFMWYVWALDTETQRALRPQMDIMCDPECSALQRKLAYDYMDNYLSCKE